MSLSGTQMFPGGPPGRNQQSEPLCPFSWHDESKPGCLAQLTLGMFGSYSLVSTPGPCMKSRCKLWDKDNDNCVFMNIKALAKQF